MTEKEIAKKIEAEIKHLPSKGGQGSCGIFASIFVSPYLSFADIANISIQVVSIISGVITIADWTYKYWKTKRQLTLEKVQAKVETAGKSCSPEQAEMIVKKVCELMGYGYPPK